MFRKMLLGCAAIVLMLALTSQAKAWYTYHYGPYGAGFHYGYGGLGFPYGGYYGYHYGGYHYGYGGAGYHYGYYRRW